MYTPQQIAQATGAPLANVQVQWPLVVDALKWAGIDSHLVRCAAIATIARETGIFWPIPEEGDEAYFRRELGDQWFYHGRGLLQITWIDNYRHYGQEVGLDLVANPDLALRNDISAKILALYFKERGTAAAANAQNWELVQTSVNGGYVNYKEIFLPVLHRILAVPEPPDGHPVTTVAVAVPLHNAPAASAPPAIDATHHPVHLEVGTRVTFTRDPHTGKEVTPQMAHVVVGGGPIHGWVLRSALRTDYVS